MKVAGKLVSIGVLATIAGIGTQAFYDARILSHELTEATYTANQKALQGVLGSLSNGMWLLAPDIVQLSLEDLLRVSNLCSATVLDENKLVTYTAQKENCNVKSSQIHVKEIHPPSPIEHKALTAIKDSTQKRFISDAILVNNDTYALIATLNHKQSQDPIGYVIAEFNLHGVQEKISQIFYSTIIRSIILCVIVSIVFFMLIRTAILKPLATILKALENISKENYVKITSIKRKDEFENLCNAFNKMIDSILQHQEKIRAIEKESMQEKEKTLKKLIYLYAEISDKINSPVLAIKNFIEIMEKRLKKNKENDEKYRYDIEKIIQMSEDIKNSIENLEAISNELKTLRDSIDQFETTQVLFEQKSTNLFPDFRKGKDNE